MIKIYYRGDCTSSRKSLIWFEKYNIDVDVKKIAHITKNDLIQILSLTNQGLDSILKKRTGKSSSKTQYKINKLMETAFFNEAIDYLLKHTELLQSPIIYADEKCLVGYNEDEIRKFIPKEYRLKYRGN